MRNMGFICPNCGENHCVANPDENTKGYEGKWYCFSCQSTGHFSIIWDVDEGSDPAPETPVADGQG
jgi:hypothetical protein